MSIYFETSNPSALLTAFKKAIDDKKVVTWAYDSDGDFTHTPEQWARKAWLRPAVSNGRLTMKYLTPASVAAKWPVYSVYHGRFVESMMEHCHDLYSEARVPPKPTSVDSVNAA